MKRLLCYAFPAVATLTALLASPAVAQTGVASSNPEASGSIAQKSAAQKLAVPPPHPEKQTPVVLPNAATLLIIQPDPSDPVYAASRERAKEGAEMTALGEEALSLGQNEKAIKAFQEAIQIEPFGGFASQRLAEAYQANHQPEQAIAAYRALIYPKPGQDWTTSNRVSATVLMKYCLVLLQMGQEQEALAMYNRGLPLLNYDNGKPKLKVLLPAIGPDGSPYTPQFLQAMACLGIGIDTSGFDEARLREAVELAPDSVAANFYLGKYLYASNKVGAKAALEKAIQLGDSTTAEEADKYLKFCH